MRSEKKSKTWKCKKGCEVGKKPCAHLEKLLPDPNKGAVGAQLKNTLKIVNTPDEFNFEAKAKELEKKLFGMGLEKFRVELIMDRYISRLTLAEIAKRRGYLSGSVVQYLIVQTVDMLKRSGHTFLSALLGNYE